MKMLLDVPKDCKTCNNNTNKCVPPCLCMQPERRKVHLQGRALKAHHCGPPCLCMRSKGFWATAALCAQWASACRGTFVCSAWTWYGPAVQPWNLLPQRQYTVMAQLLACASQAHPGMVLGELHQASSDIESAWNSAVSEPCQRMVQHEVAVVCICRQASWWSPFDKWSGTAATPGTPSRRPAATLEAPTWLW